MINMTVRIRSVPVNSRGQIVIPEDMRKSLGIAGGSSVVLIEKDDEITIRTEGSVAKEILSEDDFWQGIAAESMKRAWSKEDEIWDELFAKGELK